MASGKHSVPRGAKRYDWRSDREQEKRKDQEELSSKEEQASAPASENEVVPEDADTTAAQPAIPDVEEEPSTEATAPQRVVPPSVRPREDVVRRSHEQAKSGRRSAVIALVVILVLVVAGVGLYFGVFQEKPGQVKEGQTITVEVPDGASTSDIGKLLKEDGVISLSRDFVSRVKELGDDGKLQSGTYHFTGGADLDSIISDLANGNTGYELTIPEGFTLKQIAARVHKVCGISKSSFYKLAHTGSKKFVDKYPFLKNCYKGSMEGFLFPDTYRIDYDATAADIIDEMLAEFQVKISEVDMTYANSKNLDECDICTLASIIEKESRTSDDKRDIACVFYNRLHANMALGSDVTTYYAVGKDLTDTLTTKDLASDNPYNTRNEKNKGLPPGAICSPGLESLKAAANPTKKDYLYFFWSQSKKKTIFCTTAKEFDQAWAKYGD